MFIEAWKYLSKGMDKFEKAFLIQVTAKRKTDRRKK